MANNDHVGIVAGGAQMISAWRTGRVDARLDLNDAILRRANLVRATLNGADFKNADLEWADFRWADLVGADLSGANLSRADFHKSDLRLAVLRGAILCNTNFEDADLQGADFTGAIFLHTRLINSDMGGAKGFETTEHKGPSILDSETLMKSGYLASNFLIGCGLSDAAIRAAHSADADSITESLEEGGDYYSCFISYSDKDAVFVDQLHNDLQAKGVRCWFDKKDLKTGERILDSVYDAIRRHEKLLLVLSEYSIVSGWVEEEVSRAIVEERDRGTNVIFPIQIDNSISTSEKAWPQRIRENVRIGDFRGWRTRVSYIKALNKLVKHLKKG